MIRAAAFIIMALLLIAAVKASFNAKPPEGAFLIDEAEATAIVCNPVLVPHLAPKSKAVQRVWVAGRPIPISLRSRPPERL